MDNYSEVRTDHGQKEKELSLTDHLAELRQRLIISLIAVGIASIACYSAIDPIFALFSRPLEQALPPGTSLIFSSYPEAFFTYIKLALTSGLFLASPVVIYEILAFVSPGLYAHEKRWLYPFVFLSSFFFVGGGLFGYFIVFPSAFKFLASYTDEGLRLRPNVSEYFTLAIRLLLGFGLAFELPIVMVFLGIIGLVDAQTLRKNRKYAILIIFVLAAILTPTPDILNQVLMAGPLILLYEMSILLVWLIARKKSTT